MFSMSEAYDIPYYFNNYSINFGGGQGVIFLFLFVINIIDR